MDQIINPSWFYWIGVVSDLKILFTLTFVVSGVILGFLIAAKMLEEDIKKKWFWIFGIIFIVALIISLVIPNKETLLEMKIAEYATYNNIESIKEAIKEILGYISKSK